MGVTERYENTDWRQHNVAWFAGSKACEVTSDASGEESVAKTIESEADEDDDDEKESNEFKVFCRNWDTGLKECLPVSMKTRKTQVKGLRCLVSLLYQHHLTICLSLSLLSLNLPLRWVLTFENIYLFAVRYNLMIYKYYTSKFALLYALNRTGKQRLRGKRVQRMQKGDSPFSSRPTDFMWIAEETSWCTHMMKQGGE